MTEERGAPEWVDSHCHLDPADDLDEVLAEARRHGVAELINIGTDLASSQMALMVAAEHEGVWATVGVHPHDAAGGIDGLAGLLGNPAAQRLVVAVGECGLDYHYDHSPRAVQRDVFAHQVHLAQQEGLAVVVHSREAWDDTAAVLESAGPVPALVLHCFTGGPREAERFLALGAYLSFSGIVTFPNAPEVREAAALCPADRLLVETDSPYLAPVPHRGRRNQPAWVPLVGEVVAQVRGVPVGEVAELTSANARAVFTPRSAAR